MQELQDKLVAAMKNVFDGDRRRVEHALKVLAYALEILASEPAARRSVVTAAAVLHDIGIHEAERKYQSSAGRYQEIEGPPIAREIMDRLGMAADEVEHVCRIIANHHSARDIDTLEFRILWDADWLVNIPEELPSADRTAMEAIVNRVFKTAGGKRKAAELFLEGSTERTVR